MKANAEDHSLTSSAPDGDNWLNEKDPRKRKIIQDRLAQRARRRRLAQYRPLSKQKKDKKPAKPIAVIAPKPPESTSTNDYGLESESQSTIGPGSFAPISLEAQSTTKTSDSLATSLNADNYYLTLPGFTLCAALYNNARLQGISCLLPSLLRTPPGTPSLPLPLHPTFLQMTTIHLPYIDCLPIPKLRHNLILLNGLVDEEEFCGDLVGTTSFVVSGSQSWDPDGWVLEKEFREKWSFLFD